MYPSAPQRRDDDRDIKSGGGAEIAAVMERLATAAARHADGAGRRTSGTRRAARLIRHLAGLGAMAGAYQDWTLRCKRR
jgi:hypothetical protein